MAGRSTLLKAVAADAAAAARRDKKRKAASARLSRAVLIRCSLSLLSAHLSISASVCIYIYECLTDACESVYCFVVVIVDTRAGRELDRAPADENLSLSLSRRRRRLRASQLTFARPGPSSGAVFVDPQGTAQVTLLGGHLGRFEVPPEHQSAPPRAPSPPSPPCGPRPPPCGMDGGPGPIKQQWTIGTCF